VQFLKEAVVKKGLRKLVLLSRISVWKEYCASNYKGHETNRPATSVVPEKQQT
jgi:hypothetical protein